jgi:cell division initiation protein
MDVTPQLLQDIEFREKVRGYHPDDVDDFLERVGVAFSELVDRLRQANDRADAAEAALSERADVDETTLSRALVLAQRTADAAITEAKAEAELTLSEAKTEADRTLAEARTEAEQTVSGARAERDEVVRAAEADARAQAAAVTGPIEEEIGRLEARRADIVEQSGGLEAWLAAQRVKLESIATDLQRILDDPERLQADPAPVVDDPPAAADVAENGGEAALTLVGSDPDEGSGTDEAPETDLAASQPSEEGVATLAQADAAAVAEDDGPDGDDEAATDDEEQPERGLSPAAQSGDTIDHDDSDADESDADEDADSEIAPEALIVDLDAVESEDDLEGRPSRVSVVRSSVQQDGEEVFDEPTGSSDSFLEELRRAVEAPTDLVESDEDRALSAFFEHEEEEPKRRFGRRR